MYLLSLNLIALSISLLSLEFFNIASSIFNSIFDSIIKSSRVNSILRFIDATFIFIESIFNKIFVSTNKKKNKNRNKKIKNKKRRRKKKKKRKNY